MLLNRRASFVHSWLEKCPFIASHAVENPDRSALHPFYNARNPANIALLQFCAAFAGRPLGIKRSQKIFVYNFFGPPPPTILLTPHPDNLFFAELDHSRKIFVVCLTWEQIWTCLIFVVVIIWSKMTVRGTMVRSEVCNSWCFCLGS